MPGGVGYTENWLKANGFKGNSAVIMQAIIGAESGGNPSAKNVNSDGSIDRGLFQINNVWHPEVSDACAYNPECAVKAALKISENGSNFTPWATFNNGAYRKYLNKAIPISAGSYGSGNNPVSTSQLEGDAAKAVANAAGLGGITRALSGISGFFAMTSSKEFWVRFGEVVIGIILVYMGLHALTGQGPSATEVATSAAMAIK